MRIPGIPTMATLCCAVLLTAAPAGAQWVKDGVGVCTAAGDQYEKVIIADGSGGAYMAWRDERSGTHVYLQHIDSYGRPLWAADGIRVTDLGPVDMNPALAPDGEGGVIVFWTEGGTSWDIYAQRLDRDGNRLWGNNGVAVCNEPEGQAEPVACSDTRGGAIVAWSDIRYGNNDIYVQRVDSDGALLWTAGGVALCTDPYEQSNLKIIPDLLGGAIVCWTDYRVDAGIYARRVDPSGTPFGPANGTVICDATNWQYIQEMIPDGAGGAIIAWQDLRGGFNTDIYAQRIDMNCNRFWTTDGAPVCTAVGTQNCVSIASDGAWGAIITWQDQRDVSTDAYAQHLDPFGSPLWTTDGILLCDSPMNEELPRIVTDGTGGAIIAWYDDRSYLNHDIFAQHVACGGELLWGEAASPVCTAPIDQMNVLIISDDAGGAIIEWDDYRNNVFAADIYTQRIERNGFWGYPSPMIASARDVPGDQGGSVTLAWDASRLNVWPENMISHYTVWRALDESLALAMLGSGATLVSSADGISAEPEHPLIRTSLLKGTPYYWEQVGSVGAIPYREHYSLTLQTPFDSTAVSPEYVYFMVSAHTEEPPLYWDSPPDSGCSVDNLAPAAPLGLEGEQFFSPGGLQLTWEANSEPDLAGYHVYRGTSSGFVPGPGSFIDSTPDTVTFDGGWDWAAGYWYKVAAVDIHGNESVFAVLGPDMVTGDDPMPAPGATFLAQNWPNPFNPVTTIAFTIKEPGHVSLRIYDATGRFVTTLVDESRPAGSYSTGWNGFGVGGKPAASGVYFYRLTAGEFTGTRKMVLLR
jgi:hypothetical protein